MRPAANPWNEPCHDPNCGHGRGAHLGVQGCAAVGCSCPYFTTSPPPAQAVPRMWTTHRDSIYRRSRFGFARRWTDQWGRKVLTVGSSTTGCISWAYRTCWCNQCHEVRRASYRQQAVKTYRDIFTSSEMYGVGNN